MGEMLYLVTGGNGMVGTYFEGGIRTDIEGPEYLDVRDPRAVDRAIRRSWPDAVLHLAAETDVDRCEREQDGAYQTNAIGTLNVAQACAKASVKMLYVSTAGVFDGTKTSPYTENDLPNPGNVYGRTKLAGELFVRDLVKNHPIVRTGWMFGGFEKDKKFVSYIVNQLLEGRDEIRAVSDCVGSPTYSKDLAAGILRLLDEDRSGLIHLSNRGIATRYDMAKAIVRVLRPEVPVVAVSSEEFRHLLAPRVASEVLNCRLEFMRPWDDALTEYVTEWKQRVDGVSGKRVDARYQVADLSPAGGS